MGNVSQNLLVESTKIRLENMQNVVWIIFQSGALTHSVHNVDLSLKAVMT